MFVSDVGQWLEAGGLIGFVVANFGGVFAVLWWALGRPAEPPRPEPEDQGAMSATGVPYVPGPTGS